MDELKLREIAQAAINGDDIAYEILSNDLGSGVIVLSLLDEIQTLRSERTAWRVTAENAEKDAGRYGRLVQLFGVTKLPCLLEPVVGDYVADGKEAIDAAIDASMKDES